jgi:hypothetical protein
MATDDQGTTLVKLVGYADGRKTLVQELCCETPSFNRDPVK